MFAVLYHKDCSDGFTAWWVVNKYCKENGIEVKGMPVQYSENWDAQGVPQFIKGCDTLVVDFSFPREYMEGLKVFAKSLLVIDHHETSAADCEGLDYCVFDMTKCGSLLTWEYLFPGRAVPHIVMYANDADLWQFKLEDSKAIYSATKDLDKTIEVWNNLNVMMTSHRYSIVAKGQTLLEQVQKDIEWTINNASLALIGGHIVPIINHPRKYLSEAIGALANEQCFAAGFFMRPQGDWSVSLRSRGNFHVGTVAKSYMGGGHPGAASFIIQHIDSLLVIRCQKCPAVAHAAFYPEYYCENCSPIKKSYRKAP